MKYFEFGKKTNPLAVILHGGLAGEHPTQFVEEISEAWQKSLV